MEQETIQEKSVSQRRRWKYSLRGLLLLVALVALVFAGWKTFNFYYLKWYYPYGYSHICDVGLMFSLLRYANDHGGKYPTGGATPEASLVSVAESPFYSD
jgi:hypothetical protein